MTHTYNISGITCSGCINTIKNIFYRIPGINQVDIDQASGDTSLVMEKHVSTDQLQQALKETKYTITETGNNSIAGEASTSFWQTYKPVMILLLLILATSLTVQFSEPGFDLKHFLMHFMAGFFISFSFFKLLDVRAFANSYGMYDVVAKRFKILGVIYPFIELALGLSMLIPAIWFEANVAALIIMSIGSIGVIQNMLNKNPVKCACLGAVFNLPLGTISLLEDLLMVAMSALVLFL